MVARFLQGEGGADLLDVAINLVVEAVEQTPDNDPQKCRRLALAGEAYRLRFQQEGEAADLDQAIAIGRRAVDATPEGVRGGSDIARSLGYTYLAAFEHRGIAPQPQPQDLSNLQHDLSTLDAAIATFREALRISMRGSPAQLDLMCDVVMGLLGRYEVTGDPLSLQEAVELSDAASRRADGNEAWDVRALLQNASVHQVRYSRFREPEDIHQVARAARLALQILPRTGAEWVDAQIALATSYRHLSRAESRTELLDEAIEGLESVLAEGHPTGLRAARLLDTLGNLYAERADRDGDGRLSDLRRAVDLSTQATALVGTHDPEWLVVMNNVGIGWLDLYRQSADPADFAKAERAWREAVETWTEWHPVMPRILLQLGAALRHRAARDEDPSLLATACEAYERARGLLGEHLSELPVTERLIETAIYETIVRHLAGAYLERGYPEQALTVAENAKMGLLAAALRRAPMPGPEGVPAELLAYERGLLDDLDLQDAMELAAETSPHDSVIAGDMALRRVQGGPLGLVHPRTWVRAKLSLRRQRLAELERVCEEIATYGESGRRYVAFRRADERSWPELRAISERGGDEAGMLVAAVCHRSSALAGSPDGSDEAVLFAFRPNSQRPHVVPTGLTESLARDLQARLERELARFDPAIPRRETWDLRLRSSVQAAAQQLGDIDRLVVSTTTFLPPLPWSCLCARAGWRRPDGAPLPVVVAPSLLQFEQPPRRMIPPPHDAVVVGDPLRDLPYAEAEAREVAAVWGGAAWCGDAATKGRVRDSLSECHLAHLACHGFFVEGNPLRSGVRLADDALTAADVLRQRAQLELLVLSACDTGRGRAHPGNEFVGLTDAFLRAGARTILISLWPVQDAATAALMTDFHIRARRGDDLDVALSGAAAKVAQDPRWSNPYYWAGFLLVGDPTALEKKGAHVAAAHQ